MVRRKLRDRVVLNTSVLISSLWGGASNEGFTYLAGKGVGSLRSA